MLSVNIASQELVIKDIKRGDLPNIMKWYNGDKEYQYATGVDRPLVLQNLVKKYLEVIYCSSEFFAGIYLKEEGTMIGLIKGSMKYEDANILWIYSLMVDADYRRCGYGTKGLKMISDYFKNKYGVRKIYISVITDNKEGIKFWCKNDFVPVRKIKKHITLDGIERDVILMSKEMAK